MDTRHSNSLGRAVRVFGLVSGVVFLVIFASDYVGSYGVSIDPVLHETGKLWWLIYHDIIGALGGGITAASIVYLEGRRPRGGLRAPHDRTGNDVDP
jgi:hypothetical protein